MAATQQETDLDLAELIRLEETAERPSVKKILAAEIEKLKSKLLPAEVAEEPKASDAEPKASDAEPKASDAKPVLLSSTQRSAAAPAKYYKDIMTYAWDQSDKYMKMYVTIKGVQNLQKQKITTEFTNKSFRLRVEDLDGANYQCHVAYLWDNIVPNDCYHKVKTDSVLVMLKKSEEKKTWAYVTEREDKKKKTPKVDEKQQDPNESLMGLLKQMYDDGDDEMRRTIAKSFSESRNKTTPDV